MAYDGVVVELLPDTLERQWLWAALRALIEARGDEHVLSSPILLPSDEWFPDRWTPNEDGVARLAERLLGYAGLGDLKVEVRLFTEATEVREVGRDGLAAATSHQGAAAWFAGIHGGTCLFGAESSGLDDPIGLVAAMAHEVAHAFRRSHRLEHRDRDLEEKLTDVTTIYLGFGVLTTGAAARFVTRQHDDLGSSYSHKRQGYLAWNEMAFILATQLHLRGYDEPTVKWFAKHLPANQAAVLRTVIHETKRRVIACAMGLTEVPRPSPSPRPPATSLWRKLLSR